MSDRPLLHALSQFYTQMGKGAGQCFSTAPPQAPPPVAAAPAVVASPPPAPTATKMVKIGEPCNGRSSLPAQIAAAAGPPATWSPSPPAGRLSTDAHRCCSHCCCCSGHLLLDLFAYPTAGRGALPPRPACNAMFVILRRRPPQLAAVAVWVPGQPPSHNTHSLPPPPLPNPHRPRPQKVAEGVDAVEGATATLFQVG